MKSVHILSFHNLFSAPSNYVHYISNNKALCAGPVFHVTVISNTTGPVPLGSVVKLHYSISPDPLIGRPVQLEYRWRGNHGGWSTSTSSPNVTLTVHVTHYETSYYFCSVSINGHVLAVGRTVIKGKGREM